MKDLVTIEAICDRYQCERHKASAIMYKLPFFRVGNRMFAYQKDLDEWERGQMIYPIVKGARKKEEGQFFIPRRKAGAG